MAKQAHAERRVSIQSRSSPTGPMRLSEASVSEPVASAKVFRDQRSVDGDWVWGNAWQRFGRYDHLVVVGPSGEGRIVPAHAGELVPGSTETLLDYLASDAFATWPPAAPMQLDLDPTMICTSVDCGGRCFSAEYRAVSPRSSISTDDLYAIIRDFASSGGKTVRFDGGGDPLSHPAVRNGAAVALAQELGLDQAILTSGDMLPNANLDLIADSNCYLRVSLNAATESTRKAFHQSRTPLHRILAAIEQVTTRRSRHGNEVPSAATFLLDTMNFGEVYEAALAARDIGISHFSVRRVLGPSKLRRDWSAHELATADDLLRQVDALNSDTFRAFVPWRALDESDIRPDAFEASPRLCWQSSLKVVVEPALDDRSFVGQLCGRYRGGGIGQAMGLPDLWDAAPPAMDWLAAWRGSFSRGAISRESLPSKCVSCIDRGFIQLIEWLITALEELDGPLAVHHYKLNGPALSGSVTIADV